jgi:hypothetical protein
MSHADNARKANTPFNRRPIKVVKPGSKMRKPVNVSILERETGWTPEQYDAWHAAQRERVRAQFLGRPL